MRLRRDICSAAQRKRHYSSELRERRDGRHLFPWKEKKIWIICKTAKTITIRKEKEVGKTQEKIIRTLPTAIKRT